MIQKESVPKADTEFSECLAWWYVVRTLPECALGGGGAGAGVGGGERPAGVKVLKDTLQRLTDGLDPSNKGANTGKMLDRTHAMELRATLLTRLAASASSAEENFQAEGTEAWKALLRLNPDCIDYYLGYIVHLGVDPFDSARENDAMEVLVALKDSEAKPSRTLLRLILTYTPSTHPSFHPALKSYIQSSLEKGIPSLFEDLKTLYSEDDSEGGGKGRIIGQIAEELLEDYQKPESDPTTYIWTLYLLSSHHLHLFTTTSSTTSTPSSPSTSSSPHNHLLKSLSLIALALTHTPTLPDLLTLKSHILASAGDYLGSAAARNEARLMDGQDRWLNGLTGVGRLRCGVYGGGGGNKVGERVVGSVGSVVGMFTKVCVLYYSLGGVI
jgi:N-alpha-acetyltransferase 15/16, NatA auxiliary subunit